MEVCYFNVHFDAFYVIIQIVYALKEICKFMLMCTIHLP